MIMRCLVLIVLAFASNENKKDFGSVDRNEEQPIVVKIEEDEYFKKKTNYIGMAYDSRTSKWRAQRWSKNERKNVHNEASYKDEETAAHASDTLARKLIANGERDHKLNFPDDDTEVYAKKKKDP